MSSVPQTFHPLPAADRPAGSQGAERLRTAVKAQLRTTQSDGTEQALTLPASLLPALTALLQRLAGPEPLTILAEETEISPEDAATILGISRPLVRRRMDVGLLPFRRVGSHHRLRLADVLALRQAEQPMRQALQDLADDTDDLERTLGL